MNKFPLNKFKFMNKGSMRFFNSFVGKTLLNKDHFKRYKISLFTCKHSLSYLFLRHLCFQSIRTHFFNYLRLTNSKIA